MDGFIYLSRSTFSYQVDFDGMRFILWEVTTTTTEKKHWSEALSDVKIFESTEDLKLEHNYGWNYVQLICFGVVQWYAWEWVIRSDAKNIYLIGRFGMCMPSSCLIVKQVSAFDFYLNHRNPNWIKNPPIDGFSILLEAMEQAVKINCAVKSLMSTHRLIGLTFNSVVYLFMINGRVECACLTAVVDSGTK